MRVRGMSLAARIGERMRGRRRTVRPARRLRIRMLRRQRRKRRQREAWAPAQALISPAGPRGARTASRTFGVCACLDADPAARRGARMETVMSSRSGAPPRSRRRRRRRRGRERGGTRASGRWSDRARGRLRRSRSGRMRRRCRRARPRGWVRSQRAPAACAGRGCGTHIPRCMRIVRGRRPRQDLQSLCRTRLGAEGTAEDVSGGAGSRRHGWSR